MTAPLAFQPAIFLLGHSRAHGVFVDWRGRVARHFTVAMRGDFTDGILHLHEHFTFSDGEQQQRAWQFRSPAPDVWYGTAADVVGTAIGHIEAGVLCLRYRLRLPVMGRNLTVAMDDRLYPLSTTRAANHARMRWAGLPVGQLFLIFERD